jgi:hypothetical protein
MGKEGCLRPFRVEVSWKLEIALQYPQEAARSLLLLSLLQNNGDLAFAPGDFAGDFLFKKLNMSEMGIIGQFQNIRFVLFEILVQFGDA